MKKLLHFIILILCLSGLCNCKSNSVTQFAKEGESSMNTITRIKCKTDNCYLISEGRNAILVDTGSSQCLDLVIAECDKYDLKLIVLTHVHFDHAENAAEKCRDPVPGFPDLGNRLCGAGERHGVSGSVYV